MSKKLPGWVQRPFSRSRPRADFLFGEKARGLDEGGPSAFAAEHSVRGIGAFEQDAKPGEVGGRALAAGSNDRQIE